MAFNIPWSGMMPVAGMTLAVWAMGSLVNWHYHFFRTEGRPRRFALDYFDNVMKERDEKLTGSMYKQQSHPFSA